MRSSVALATAGVFMQVACGISLASPIMYQPGVIADSATRARRIPQHLPDQVGMRGLDSTALPPGYREVRIELDCSLCLPLYLVRFIQGPDRRVFGEGYILASTFTADGSSLRSAGDSGREAQRVLWLQNLASHAGCDGWIRGQSDYVWCRTERHPPEGWAGLLAAMDSLGVSQVGSLEGYNPTPPSFRPWGTDTLPSAVGNAAGCNDLGGKGLTVVSLQGDQFRTAYFWCLENPRGDEHKRMAAAFGRLLTLFEE